MVEERNTGEKETAFSAAIPGGTLPRLEEIPSTLKYSGRCINCLLKLVGMAHLSGKWDHLVKYM